MRCDELVSEQGLVARHHADAVPPGRGWWREFHRRWQGAGCPLMYSWIGLNLTPRSIPIPLNTDIRRSTVEVETAPQSDPTRCPSPTGMCPVSAEPRPVILRLTLPTAVP